VIRSSRFRADGNANFQVLWEDGEYVFCRGTGDVNADHSTVLAVLPAVEHPTRATLDRITHEYGLKDELDEAWAVRPLELIREGDRTMLVLEDPGGEPLDSLLGAPLEVGRFLRFSIGIAALGKAHQRGFVHKDLKPAHILVNRNTGEVKLTGFGIASRLPRDRQATEPPETIAGTLAHMAPEQTGRNNVVDFMVRKLTRLPAETREAMQRLACLRNLAEITRPSVVLETSEEQLHAALWPAVQHEFVECPKGAYKLLHDQIQQAAYSQIPEEHLAEVHHRIGRLLLAGMTADELNEHLFNVSHQLNRGGALLIDRDEKGQLATINLRAERKAKASAAYGSASLYFRAGMALLDEKEWSCQYDLMFSLRLECAECEFLTGDFDTAEHLIAELLQRGTSKVDLETVYHLQVQLHGVKGEYRQAVGSALTCLRLFGVDVPANPTWEQVHIEYETVWRNLNRRPIETLIDLPLMTDPEMLAEMDIGVGL
jgi:hypothetical protein